MRLKRLAVVAMIAACNTACFAESLYEVFADSSQVVSNPSSSTATAVGMFSLNNAQTHLTYDIQLNGLDLEPDPSLRTDPNDVVGMHIHLNVVDAVGPHILNIFGNPSEDDADLVVDFDNESLSGIFDISDASVDPDTGEVLPQFFPLTTKLIADWIDELNASELYLAVHTVSTAPTPPGVTIRGTIVPVPEPALAGWLLALLVLISIRRN